ncbi:MAG: hypothetical protein H0Z28_05590 [Archaeoglobus sp.]|nr:hypothetical protein [Archaeoglobus sp.]
MATLGYLWTYNHLFGRKWGKDLLEAGALKVIDKPFTKEKLIETMEKYL